MTTGDIVRIDWQDHYSNTNGWQNLSDLHSSKLTTIICSSVGLVVKQDKDQIVIAQNWHPIDNTPDLKVADFMVVLKRCIKKTTTLMKKEFTYK